MGKEREGTFFRDGGNGLGFYFIGLETLFHALFFRVLQQKKSPILWMAILLYGDERFSR